MSIPTKVHGAVFGSEQKIKDPISKTVRLNPGPGAYLIEDKLDSVSKKSPNAKFGTSTRNFYNKSHLANPGPGSYAIDRQLGKNSPSFSLSPKRTDNTFKKKDNPGPGQYEPDSSFSK